MSERLGAADRLHAGGQTARHGPPGSDAALAALLRARASKRPYAGRRPLPGRARADFDPGTGIHRQFDELVALHPAADPGVPEAPPEFWSKVGLVSRPRWKQTTAPLRDYIWDELIGRLRRPSVSDESADPPHLRPRRSTAATRSCWTSGPACSRTAFCWCPRISSPASAARWWFANTGWKGARRTSRIRAIDSPYYHRFAVAPGGTGFRHLRAAEPVHRRRRKRQTNSIFPASVCV